MSCMERICAGLMVALIVILAGCEEERTPPAHINEMDREIAGLNEKINRLQEDRVIYYKGDGMLSGGTVPVKIVVTKLLEQLHLKIENIAAKPQSYEIVLDSSIAHGTTGRVPRKPLNECLEDVPCKSISFGGPIR